MRRAAFRIIFTTTLLAGERSGNLEEVLQRYTEFQRVSLTVTKKAQGRAGLPYAADHACFGPVRLPDHVRRATFCYAIRPDERAAA